MIFTRMRLPCGTNKLPEITILLMGQSPSRVIITIIIIIITSGRDYPSPSIPPKVFMYVLAIGSAIAASVGLDKAISPGAKVQV